MDIQNGGRVFSREEVLKMTWEDVDDVLFDGTEEAIKATVCPECGGVIMLKYSEAYRSYETYCNSCYTLRRAHGAPHTPNFALFGIRQTQQAAANSAL